MRQGILATLSSYSAAVVGIGGQTFHECRGMGNVWFGPDPALLIWSDVFLKFDKPIINRARILGIHDVHVS